MPKLISEVRLENARRLVQEAGGTAAFARRMDMSTSQAGQIVGRSPIRNIGPGISRRLEVEFGKPKGWMDVEQVSLTIVPRRKAEPGNDVLAVPRYEAPASMGTGLAQPEQDTVVGALPLHRGWVRQNLRSISSMENLAVITGMGDSMEPTFSDGDILIVDRGVTEVKVDTIYVMALKNELYIKRLHRNPKTLNLEMSSDNRPHGIIELNEADLQDFQILGRVVWVWNGKRISSG